MGDVGDFVEAVDAAIDDALASGVTPEAIEFALRARAQDMRERAVAEGSDD